jgi:hypothetical protein
MSTTFGAPLDDVAEQPGVAGTANGTGADKVQDIIDPNDPMLTSESLDVNLDGDAYAFPPPPPDGKYRAKLKLMPIEQTDASGHKSKVDYVPKRHDKQGLYLHGAVEAHIIDPSGKYDNIPVYDRWVGTFLGRDNSTKVSTILGKLRQPDGAPWVKPGQKMTHALWMQTFVRALAGEPEIGIETQWEWSCQACGEEAKKKGTAYPRSITGMQKFPMDMAKSKPNAPVYQSEMRCQVSPAHGFSRAQVRIARFLTLSDLK